MVAAVWLMLSGLIYSLQLSTGSFPRLLTRQEEEKYLAPASMHQKHPLGKIFKKSEGFWMAKTGISYRGYIPKADSP